MAPVGPWAQPKATRREGGRRAERPAGSYATPDTPCSRTAPEGSLPTERGQTVPALRPELDDPNKFGSSNRSAPAGRSPRRIATWAASGVAVPRAFFGTFFRFERKYCPTRGGSPTTRAGVGASIPTGAGVCACGHTKGLSSGQTIGAVRTAVRSACCLPELRVANRLRRLYPLDTRFPSFPFGNLRAPKLARNP